MPEAFDDTSHRVESAAAAVQKGIYQLFVLELRSDCDEYARLLRIYQCVFQACVSQILLDQTFSMAPLAGRIPKRMQALCRDPGSPSPRDLDAAALLNHSVFETGRWQGFPLGHELHEVSTRTLSAYSRIVHGRHNLLYRPFLLEGPVWQDCPLIDLVGNAPVAEDLSSLYRAYIESLWILREAEGGARLAEYFLQTLFMPFETIDHARPKETLLASYARLLVGENTALIAELRLRRNELLGFGSDDRWSSILLPPEWHAGEL